MARDAGEGARSDRLLEPAAGPGEAELDQVLRPRTLAAYVGQSRVKENLAIFIEAARQRGEALDHVLLSGPPGLGKTTLANIVANEMGVNIRVTSGPAIERQGDLIAILTNLEPRDVLFIDEIHRLSRTVEEVLYPAMEDGAVDIVIGQGPAARSVRLELPPFTLVGATTRQGMLTSPLRDRFGVLGRLEYYTAEELQTILERAAAALNVAADPEGLAELARRSRGTPRVALRLLRRVRDVAQVRGEGRITAGMAREALALLDVDSAGLDRNDRRVLEAIIDLFGGGPVGVETLAASISEDVETVEDVYEPFLMQRGFLQRTPRGRVATPAAYAHLGKTAPPRGNLPPEDQGALFP